MKRERLKSIILFLLIANSVFLTSQIWFDKRLWPDGYNLFNSFPNIPIIGSFFQKTDDDVIRVSSLDHIIKPYRIILNASVKTSQEKSLRSIYHQNDSEYDEIEIVTERFIKAIYMPNSAIIEITQADWLNAFSSSAIILDYGAVIDTTLFEGPINSHTAFTSTVQGFREIAIMPDNAIAYIRSIGDEKYYTVKPSFNSEPLQRVMAMYAAANSSKAPFAYEMKLGQSAQGDTASQEGMLLDPMVLIPSTEFNQEERNIYIKNPLTEDKPGNFYDSVVTAFGLQASNLRKSVNSNGTISYIENHATVEISPTGRIEYRAVDASSGISLESLYEKITFVLDIARKQWELFVPEQPFNVRLNSNTNRSEKNTIITMEYMFNGIPVISTDLQDDCTCSIYAEFTNNRMVKFGMILRSMELLDSSSPLTPLPTALDSIYNKAEKSVAFAHVFTCYPISTTKQDGEIEAVWAATQDNLRIYTQQ